MYASALAGLCPNVPLYGAYGQARCLPPSGLELWLQSLNSSGQAMVACVLLLLGIGLCKMLLGPPREVTDPAFRPLPA